MKSHRKAREVALQVLFQNGFQENQSAIDLFHSFAMSFTFDLETRDHALFLTQGVLGQESEINDVITRYSNNWRIDRIAMLDKILLQIAIFELMFSKSNETAPKLILIDIIDLAKKYSSEDSKNFINGILDQIYHSISPTQDS